MLDAPRGAPGVSARVYGPNGFLGLGYWQDDGRFAPRAGELAEVTQGLEATEPEGLPPILALRDFITRRKSAVQDMWY